MLISKLTKRACTGIALFLNAINGVHAADIADIDTVKSFSLQRYKGNFYARTINTIENSGFAYGNFDNIVIRRITNMNERAFEHISAQKFVIEHAGSIKNCCFAYSSIPYFAITKEVSLDAASYAFEHSNGLSYFGLPDNITSVNVHCFENCNLSQLETLAIYCQSQHAPKIGNFFTNLEKGKFNTRNTKQIKNLNLSVVLPQNIEDYTVYITDATKDLNTYIPKFFSGNVDVCFHRVPAFNEVRVDTSVIDQLHLKRSIDVPAEIKMSNQTRQAIQDVTDGESASDSE